MIYVPRDSPLVLHLIYILSIYFLLHLAVASCPTPSVPTNGQITSSTPPTNGQLYQSGSVVRFSCNSGYTLNGATSVTCQSTGNWNSAFPTCTGKNGRYVFRGQSDHTAREPVKARVRHTHGRWHHLLIQPISIDPL